MPLQKLQSLRPQIETRGDPEPLHLRGGGRSDAVESSDQQGFDEQGPFLRSDDKEPIRLVVIGSQFREELVVG
ncbi:MAG TPA: hypothetical protein VE687_02595, partial [Stellaceae bacterium]|nr:hypothetical protein [Stellaceae bacterium]